MPTKRKTRAIARPAAGKYVEPVNPPTLENVPDYNTLEGARHWKEAKAREQQVLFDTLRNASARDRLKRGGR